MSDDRLLATYARIVQAREPRTRVGCAAPEALQGLVEQRGPEAERLQTLNHAMSCPACRRELDLLRAVHTTRPTLTRRVMPLALAASLVLAVGITYGVRARQDRDLVDPVRAGDDVVVVTPRDLVADGQPMPFVWRSVPGATGYELSIVADDGTQLGPFTTRDTSFALTSQTPLRRDVEYAWTVNAHVAGGDRKSAPARFHLRAP